MERLAETLFEFLPGRWHLARAIDGHAIMEGLAIFTRDCPTSLSYREDLTVRLQTGVTCAAYQDYRYVLSANGISVLFGDGRPFHEILFTAENRAVGEHLCGHDSYSAEYEFTGDLVLVTWLVRGPRKDYRARSTYTRII